MANDFFSYVLMVMFAVVLGYFFYTEITNQFLEIVNQTAGQIGSVK